MLRGHFEETFVDRLIHMVVSKIHHPSLMLWLIFVHLAVDDGIYTNEYNKNNGLIDLNQVYIMYLPLFSIVVCTPQ